MPVTIPGYAFSPSAAAGPTYSGNELFLYEAGTAVARGATNAESILQADGWNNVKTETSATGRSGNGARGFVYTETPGNISGNPLGGSLPSGRDRCLAMEMLCYTGQSQTDVYPQIGSTAGDLPTDLWLQFWAFQPDELTSDTKVFVSDDTNLAWDATYDSTTQFTISGEGNQTPLFTVGYPVSIELTAGTVYSHVASVNWASPDFEVTLEDAVLDNTITTVNMGHCWYPSTYVSTTRFDILNLSVADRFDVGEEIQVQLGTSSRATSTVASVNYDGNDTQVTLGDAILDNTITYAEYKSWTKGLTDTKFMYISASGSYPAQTGNGCDTDSGFVFSLSTDQLPGGDSPTRSGAIVDPEADANITNRPTNCTSRTTLTKASGEDWTGPNLGENKPPIKQGQWSLVKIHLDYTAIAMHEEVWVRYHGESSFTKTYDWEDGVTILEDDAPNTINYEAPFTGTPTGMAALRLISTTGGTTALKGNWFDTILHFDDICMCNNEADLPQYFDGV